MSGDAVQGFLPDLARARAAGVTARAPGWLPFRKDLLGGAPAQSIQTACVITRARVIERSAREERIDVAERRLASIPQAMPAPPSDFAGGHQRILLEALGPVLPCSHCSLLGSPLKGRSSGRVECGICNGLGFRIVEERTGNQVREIRVPCDGCARRGWYACTTCEGTGLAVPVRAMTVSDQLHTLRYTYLPALPMGLGEAVLAFFESAFPQETPLPEVLQISLDRALPQSAYRSGGREAEPSFHGFSLAGALPAARDAVERLRAIGDAVREDVRAFAWPLLHLHYSGFGGGTDVALVVDPSGRPHAIVG